MIHIQQNWKKGLKYLKKDFKEVEQYPQAPISSAKRLGRVA